MDLLDLDDLKALLALRDPPCLTLYQPTHRHHPDNLQDRIRFRNLVKGLEDAVRQAHPADTTTLLAPFHALADDRAFWNHALDGLAVLGGRGVFRAYRLQRPVVERQVVADRFHAKPLLRTLQSADRYQVLGLSRHAIRLFEGNRDVLDEIEPAAGVPRTITDALGDELTEPHLTVASYGGVGRGQSAMHHGHGSKAEEVDVDAERYFRAVDRAVLERHSRPTGLPLILVTLPEHRTLFHALSHNPHLLDEGLDVHPDALTPDELRRRVWEVVEPRYLTRLARLVEAFGGARAQDLGDDDVGRVAQAVVAGRVGTLLVEAERVVAGSIDEGSGDFRPGDLDDPEVGDALDDLASSALLRGADVVVVPAERMPTSTGVAAIYRY